MRGSKTDSSWSQADRLPIGRSDWFDTSGHGIWPGECRSQLGDEFTHPCEVIMTPPFTLSCWIRNLFLQQSCWSWPTTGPHLQYEGHRVSDLMNLLTHAR